MSLAVKLKAEIAALKRGESIGYHIGLLMRDRQADSELAEVADAAWAAYQDGVVVLVQRRAGPGSCEYLAVRR